MLMDKIRVRFIRSARTPTGMVAMAQTRVDTVTRKPMPELFTRKADSSCGARALMAPTSAPLKASTAASITIALRRAGPPTVAVSLSLVRRICR
jgi:hypothetical protein